MKQNDLSKECNDLQLIIENLEQGKEEYEIDDDRFSLKEGIDYLRDYLQELKALNHQIIEEGNTPENMKKVYDEYTELWLFQLKIRVDSLPRVIGRLWRYPNDEE